MRVFITGATGFIGRALVPALQRQGHTVAAWTRSGPRARARLGADIETVPITAGDRELVDALNRCDAVVNLAGESLVGHRWTRARRARLWGSRVGVTHRLVRGITAASRRPRVLVSGSAVGYYGDGGSVVLDETASRGHDFLARLCGDWEAAARFAEALGLRVVTLRTGVVLGRDGGALALLIPLFKLGLGGRVGSGEQYLPWIHLHDFVRIVTDALADERYEGVVNAVAPEAVQNRTFTAALGAALRRPAIVPVPAPALRAVWGGSAATLLSSQRVEPATLRRLGFAFTFRSLPAALADIIGGAPIVVEPAVARRVDREDAASRRYLDAGRPTHELRLTTRLDVPLDAAFAFFSKAENLGVLTPSAMQFSIAGDPPVVAEHTAIEYRLRVGPFPVTWRSRIVNWVPGVRFVDLQERGPYRAWWHEHSFRADGAATVMEDRVCYAPPLGILGRVANRLFIVPTLRRIFQYRADVIGLRFGRAEGSRSIA